MSRLGFGQVRNTEPNSSVLLWRSSLCGLREGSIPSGRTKEIGDITWRISTRKHQPKGEAAPLC